MLRALALALMIVWQLGASACEAARCNGRQGRLSSRRCCCTCQPANAAAFAKRAEGWAKTGQTEKAIADIARAIKLAPANNEYRLFHALLLGTQNRNDEAIGEVNRIAASEPEGEFAKTFRAVLNLATSWTSGSAAGIDRAIDDLDLAFDDEPDDRWRLALRGAALEKQEKFAEAVALYSRYLDKYSGQKEIASIYLARSEAYRRLGQYALALDDCAASIRLAPDRFAGYARKAWLLATCADDKLRNGQQAVELALRAYELNSWKPGTLPILAAAYAECGQFDEAIAWQTKALAALDAPITPRPPVKTHQSHGKTVWTWTLWDARPANRQADRQTASARLESYRQGKPLRE
jgi:tetratricopeptide (TPR) repeat protein